MSYQTNDARLRAGFHRRGALLIPVLALFAGPTAHAQGAPQVQVPVEKYVLPNGLEVLLHQDRSVPLAYVSVWYHVGSGDETPGRSGFAHLFEHMMFQRSKNVPRGKHFEILQRAGASDVNGTTTSDRTNYYQVVPAHQLETALWLESDRMGFLPEALTEENLDNQREVVRNERRQRIENVAYGAESLATSRALYPEGHPYRHLVIGKHEEIEAARLEDVTAFFRTWYVPSNATLLIAGDFDVGEAKRLIARWFGTLPTRPRPAHPKVPTPVLTETRREMVADPFAPLRRLRYAWHAPVRFTPEHEDLSLLSGILSTRLGRALVVERPLAQEVSCVQEGRGLSGIFSVVVTLRADADLATVEQVVAEALQKVTSEPVSDREYRRARLASEAGLLREYETLAGRGERLQTYNHFRGNPDSVPWHLQAIRDAVPERMARTAAQYLRAPRVEILTLPQPVVPTAGGN